MTTLTLRRKKAAWQDRMRSYRVFVDGQEVAQIGNGREIKIPVAAGKRVVQLKIDWCRSEAMEVDVKPLEPQILECGPNAKPWLALLYITLLKNRYLWIRRAPGTV